MPSQSDIREIEQGRAKRKRRITAEDWSNIAEQITDLHETRKRKRRDLESQAKEIDRQLRMEPDLSYKQLPGSDRIDPKKAWMPELELPLQSQTLEVLNADANRMTFPDSGSWFVAHAEIDDDYLEKVEGGAVRIAGDSADVPSLIDQDNADKIVEGQLAFYHRQYDFDAHVDLINAEAFKYGMGIGRVGVVTKSVFMDTARGTLEETKQLPVLFPRSFWNTYPDDEPSATMNEGYIVGPSTIFVQTKRYVDVIVAANKGGNDPNSLTGGWMPSHLKGLEPDGDGNVEMLEYEGDLLVSRKSTRTLFLPGVVVTVVKGQVGGKPAQRVIRFRFRKIPSSSYVLFPYQREDQNTIYSTSPLLKGMPIQQAAVQALLRLMQAAAYKGEPALRYDPSDMALAEEGGPNLFPGALLASIGAIDALEFGELGPLFQVYVGLLLQYADVTGVNQPRLGAQTVSHTTAFAKEAELARGTVRTVKYVKSALRGPLATWLGMEYELGRKLKQTNSIYLDAYKSFVEIEPEGLPGRATFEVFGAGGPLEESQKQQRRFAALNQAIQIDQLRAQQGQEPILNLPDAIRQILSQGGWIDPDAFIRAESLSQGASGAPALGAPDQGDGQGPAIAALQSLAASAG